MPAASTAVSSKEISAVIGDAFALQYWANTLPCDTEARPTLGATCSCCFALVLLRRVCVAVTNMHVTAHSRWSTRPLPYTPHHDGMEPPL